MPPKAPPMREKVTKPMDKETFIAYVVKNYFGDMPPVKAGWRAAELWRIALEFSRTAAPCDGGRFWCSAVGGPGGAAFVTITDDSEKNSSRKMPETVAKTPAVRYASPISVKSVSSKPDTRRRIMPARKPAAKPVEPEVVEEVEAEAEETEKDYTVYATKNITPAMQDFHDWLMQEVGDLSEMDTVRIVALAGTLRMEFQRSEFNQTRRAERAAERAAAAAAAATEAEVEVEAETTPTKPVAAKRGVAKPTTAKATTAKPAAAKRGAPKAAAGTAAPY